jgi:hypothetical protein
MPTCQQRCHIFNELEKLKWQNKQMNALNDERVHLFYQLTISNEKRAFRLSIPQNIID